MRKNSSRRVNSALGRGIFWPTVTLAGAALSLLLSPATLPAQDGKKSALQAGFGAADITPKVEGKTVYMAGFGQNRKATRVHDPIMARAIVLHDGTKKIALVSVDLVGLFLEEVEAIRQGLPGFDYVL